MREPRQSGCGKIKERLQSSAVRDRQRRNASQHHRTRRGQTPADQRPAPSVEEAPRLPGPLALLEILDGLVNNRGIDSLDLSA